MNHVGFYTAKDALSPLTSFGYTIDSHVETSPSNVPNECTLPQFYNALKSGVGIIMFEREKNVMAIEPFPVGTTFSEAKSKVDDYNLRVPYSRFIPRALAPPLFCIIPVPNSPTPA